MLKVVDVSRAGLEGRERWLMKGAAQPKHLRSRSGFASDEASAKLK